MPATYVVTSLCWQFVDHWQTLIAGILAVIAAIGTIVVTLIAAAMAVKAAREQTAFTLAKERRNAASDSLIAGQLIDGVLATIIATCDLLDTDLSLVDRNFVPSELAKSLYETLAKPDLAVVWGSLGRLGREIVSKYLHLDTTIDLVWNTKDDVLISKMVFQVEGIAKMASDLRIEITQSSKPYLDILTKGQ